MPRKMTCTHRMDDLVNAAKAELEFTKENPVTRYCHSASRLHQERVEKLERICKELWMLRSDDDRDYSYYTEDEEGNWKEKDNVEL